MTERPPIVAELAAHRYTGLSGETHSAILTEWLNVRSRVQWRERVPGRDALLSRVRNTLLSDAVASKDVDVQVWLDHDIQFQPGALTGLVLRCAETKGIVGGLYPYRAKGSLGFPIRITPGQEFRPQIRIPASMSVPVQPGDGELHPVEAAGGGFVAFWIPAIREGLARLEAHPDPDMRVTQYVRGRSGGLAWDFCRPYTRVRKDQPAEYVSEDWAACLRLGAIGMPCHVWTAPYLLHYGEIAFTPEDACGGGINVPEALREWERNRDMEGKAKP